MRFVSDSETVSINSARRHEGAPSFHFHSERPSSGREQMSPEAGIQFQDIWTELWSIDILNLIVLPPCARMIFRVPSHTSKIENEMLSQLHTTRPFPPVRSDSKHDRLSNSWQEQTNSEAVLDEWRGKTTPKGGNEVGRRTVMCWRSSLHCMSSHLSLSRYYYFSRDFCYSALELSL